MKLGSVVYGGRETLHEQTIVNVGLLSVEIEGIGRLDNPLAHAE